MADRFLPRDRFPALVEALRDAGYRCLGPRVREGAIVMEEVERAADLCFGLRDRQAPGSYRLEEGTGRHFAWANGPTALKPLTFVPRETLWRARREGGGLRFEAPEPEVGPLAVIGARACDLAGLALQDRHFLEGEPDPFYKARRERLFLVAVNCTHPADTCFCASTGDGPRAEHSFDLVLSELDEGFLVAAGGPAGADILAALPTEEAGEERNRRADAEIEAAAQAQKRSLPSRNLRDFLFGRQEHPRWEEVAERCLSCGNCTNVCPTCFCHSQETVPDLEGEVSDQVRQWDSCFTSGHSYIHGIVVRATTANRYRQWLTHKLGGWHDQFGRSGCVGCGRCITWCPTGIDLTEEVAALGEEPGGA
ncbi:cytochrome C [Thiohalorhabdus denitrificans]|uniref:4Fe-4S dicluster domain-containing protein n=1 Tax=Thiohalorhabdus denitrificans TaxID=381306 RepID=A0A0P9EBX7_9GAMM|nr:4Fe-4S dicluster domain-containing protein [Thiohalorhabdus denitrificans]KPV39785.1 cytochrome C [Thiohalorhabdus denitrificans]SCX94374.1 4Fe-4S dicluster domain-containing protein [Thiohalorhabdus denitrificans]